MSKTDSNNIEQAANCFQQLNKEDLAFITHKKTQIEYQKGDTIFKQGAFAPHVLFVNSGLVKMYLQTGKDKQINIRLAKKGDFMALSSVFGEEKYNYSANALSDSVICMIDKQALKQILLRNPAFAMQITSRYSNYENRFLEIIKNVSYKQMRGKLASAILYLGGTEFENEDVFSLLSRKEIADFASISIESTVKFLKEFEKENLIFLRNKDIIINDTGRLQELSDFA